MHKKLFAAFGAGILLACSPAMADSPQLSSQQLRVREEIIRLLKDLPEQQRTAVLSGLARQQKQAKTEADSMPANVTTAMASSSSAKPAGGASPPAKQGPVTAFLGQNEKDSAYQKSGCQGFGFLLRQDWKDMGYGNCPDTIDKATGAQVSYTDDRVAANRIWAVHGTTAIVYNANIPNKPDTYSFSRIGFGGYATVNRLTNSATSQAKSNIDTAAYGGFAILALATPVDVGWTHWFRIRGGGVENHLKDITNVNVTGEWLPVNPNWYFHRPFQPLGLPTIIRFDPELIVQYDSVQGKNQILTFNNRPDSLRVGPQLAVKILPPPGASDFLARFNGNVSYHWMYETYSGKKLNWFDSSLTYNLDQAGNFGLTGSYSRGQDENTGADTNLYKLSLSGKI